MNAYRKIRLRMILVLLQEQLQNTSDERNKHSEERQYSVAAVHTPHVPGPSALACEAQLQGLLACEDCRYKLQLSDELHPLESCCTASKSQQCHASFQL